MLGQIKKRFSLITYIALAFFLFSGQQVIARSFSDASSVSISIDAGKGTVVPGEIINYTIRIENEDANTAIPNLVMRNELPGVLTYNTGSLGFTGTDSVPEWVEINNAGTWELTWTGDIPASDAIEIYYEATVDRTTAEDEVLNILRVFIGDSEKTDSSNVSISKPLPGTIPESALKLPLIRHNPYTYEDFPTISNGSFELGPVDWNEFISSGLSDPLILKKEEGSVIPENVTPYDDYWLAWLGGFRNTTTEIEQEISFSGLGSLIERYKIHLSFYNYRVSLDSCGNDSASIYIGDQILQSYELCEEENTPGWQLEEIDLRDDVKDIPDTITLKFSAALNATENSNWFIDKISLCSTLLNAPDNFRCPEPSD